MTETLHVFAPGRPAPQGSKRSLGRGRMVEMSKYLPQWRRDVIHAVSGDTWVYDGVPMFSSAVVVELRFVLPRPKRTPKKTPLAITRPDLDKLGRAVFDALSLAGVYDDDSRVVVARLSKRIAEPGETTGCLITVRDAV